MYAIALHGAGGPEVMHWEEVPDPQPGPGQVLIDVVAAAVNRADVMQRRGFYPPPPGASDIPGLECSGVIAELGPGVTGWSVGDRVCALLSGGGYAEKVAVAATQLMPIPDGVDLPVAASLPEVTCTVWSNLVMGSGLRAGQLLLIHGGASGIGTHGIQLARARGAKVAVTAGSQYKLDACRDLGAQLLINYREDDFVEAVRNFDGHSGADIILDNMGAAYLDRNVDALAADGQLVIIGMQGGASGELALNKLLGKRGTIRATSLRGRPETGRSSKAEIVADVVEHVWPLIADGSIAPVVYAEVPITQVGKAHEMLDSPETIGKVVLRVR
ncbi:NAD(P)H-quinone oxidoreductase [Skermania sp. ID1734]|uniref:NAD(P)H-quinone oxidoreductase n=1 Tax=Skermania sp. ID1734 TaxID=2597516 RepID=UPI00117D3B77|nr:NAD(P)H-quinone oxidoreductase [Skermania sp. ID1734]TSE00702.1 NAD(P)H-quinone oxidoreductase [Skermania sp. ID1734]